MDPNACWTNLCTACNEESLDEAYDAAKHLVDWLDRGGLTPQDIPRGMTRDGLRTLLIMVVASTCPCH